LRPHSLCRSATVNTPANRQMRLALVVGHNSTSHGFKKRLNYSFERMLKGSGLKMVQERFYQGDSLRENVDFRSSLNR